MKHKAVSFWLPGVNVIPDTPTGAAGVAMNSEETQTWAFAVSDCARKKAVESSNKSVAAWGNDFAILPNLLKGLRMGVRSFHVLATSHDQKTARGNCTLT